MLRVPVALLLTVSMPGVALAQYPLVTAPADELSDDEKIEKAKGLYIEAERLADEDNWEAAVVLYEQAYYLVPGKHGFAHKVGIAAWKVDNCDKAYDYLTHFVEYGEADKYPEKITEAQGILEEIEAKGCRTPEEEEPEPEAEAPTDVENPFATEAGDGPGDSGKKPKEKGDKGLLIGGAVMITLGLAGVGAGAAGSAIAVGAGKSLDQLASTSTNTGYPVGDYACRNVDASDCPVTLESRLATGKVLTYAGFIGGGVLVAAGIALIAIHAKKNKAKAGASAKAKNGVELTAIGPTLLPGGGGAAAAIRF
ncbi:hypothetical protein [Enhygromyxa salina]|nr:hypothetical protein [Enhygromyxa salina]